MIKINRSIDLPLACGSDCYFCRFQLDDDRYHCIFFNRNSETEIINMCADDSVKYANCPLVDEATDFTDIVEV